MSAEIREYESIPHNRAESLHVGSTVQGKYGHGVQFTVGGSFCVLAQNQVKDLIRALQARIDCEDGYAATGYGEAFEKVVPAEGGKEDKDDD